MRGLTWWMDLVTINHRTPVDDLLRFTFLVGCSWVPNRSLELLVGQSGGIWKPVLIAVAVKHILRTRTSNPLGEQEHQTLLKIYFGFCKSLVVSLQSKKNGAHFSGLKPPCNNHHTRNSHALWLRSFMNFYGWDHPHSPIFSDGKEIVYHSSTQIRMEHINTSKQYVFSRIEATNPDFRTPIRRNFGFQKGGPVKTSLPLTAR